MKSGFVYIIANQNNGTLYVGVTSNLIKRVYEHRNSLVEGFTQKYGLIKLVYFEVFEDIASAIEREKQLKAGNRKKKISLIEANNASWSDLYSQILE